MSESRNPRDPESATDDPFLDAVLGLESLGRRFDALVAPGAPLDALPGDALTIDALLGLVSLRHTLRLVVEALCSEGSEAAERSMMPEAAWPRDLLR